MVSLITGEKRVGRPSAVRRPSTDPRVTGDQDGGASDPWDDEL